MIAKQGTFETDPDHSHDCKTKHKAPSATALWWILDANRHSRTIKSKLSLSLNKISWQ
jgi:hypothetical protein